MIQRAQTDKVVARCLLCAPLAHPPPPQSPTLSFCTAHRSLASASPLVVSSPRCFFVRSSRWTKISHRAFVRFDLAAESTREGSSREDEDKRDLGDPTLTHYRQVPRSLSQKIDGDSALPDSRHLIFSARGEELLLSLQLGTDSCSIRCDSQSPDRIDSKWTLPRG